MMRYIVWLMAIVGLIIVLVILLSPGSSKPTTPPAAKSLPSFASTDAQASLTIDGPVNANQDHQAIRITVGRDNVTFEQLTGYEGQVVNLQSYSNTEAAYDVFLRSISYGGFTRGNTDKNLSDERGYCPLGDRYIFDFNQDGNDLQRFWSTSCGSPKTYKGDVLLTIRLFQAQVPDYSKLSQNVSL